MKDNNKLNEKLVAAIKKSLSNRDNIANELMDTLFIGKEAVYRRLRGEVPFTFDEVASISARLGFSVDSVLGVENQNSAVFDVNLLDPGDIFEDYHTKLSDNIKMVRKMRKTSHSEVRFALNSLPYSFFFPYEYLSKFRLYRWMYQASKINVNMALSELSLPTNVVDIQKTYLAEHRYISKTIFILDRNVFSSFVNDISYFSKLNLISKEEQVLLRDELLSIIDDLEELAISGQYNSGQSVFIYISDIDLDSFYIHYEADGFEMAHLKLYSINGITSFNPQICKQQKEWIESMKRYSTLITQSGEVLRYVYFNKQRSLIRGLCSE